MELQSYSWRWTSTRGPTAQENVLSTGCTVCVCCAVCMLQLAQVLMQLLMHKHSCTSACTTWRWWVHLSTIFINGTCFELFALRGRGAKNENLRSCTSLCSCTSTHAHKLVHKLMQLHKCSCVPACAVARAHAVQRVLVRTSARAVPQTSHYRGTYKT